VRNVVRAFLVLLACTLPAAATTIVPMSVEQLTQAASHIVEGQALRSWSAWNAQHTLIYTYTSFAVSRSLKGNAPAVVTVKQLGGSAGGYTQHVSGVRHFQSGEQALLFLRPSVAADGTLVVVGLMQGNYRIYENSGGESMVSNGVTGAQQYDHGQIENFSGSSLRLQDVEARVRRLTQ
jgi:hypothetical protein